MEAKEKNRIKSQKQRKKTKQRKKIGKGDRK